MYQSILVPVDGSECARKALALACQLTKGTQAALYLLNIPESPAPDATIGVGVGAVPLDYAPEEVERNGRAVLEKAQRAIGMQVHDAQLVVRQGQPARVIIDEANRLGVDAVVMGSRGLSDMKGLMIGSVSHKVSHVAPCTVITVH